MSFISGWQTMTAQCEGPVARRTFQVLWLRKWLRKWLRMWLRMWLGMWLLVPAEAGLAQPDRQSGTIQAQGRSTVETDATQSFLSLLEFIGEFGDENAGFQALESVEEAGSENSRVVTHADGAADSGLEDELARHPEGQL